jgi:flavorubredoxin
MAKVIIIYDSGTGNTELMVNAVAEGARSVKNVEVQLHKIGTRFSIHILKDADGVIIGSPTIYGNMTHRLVEFFNTLRYLRTVGRIILNGKKGAAFGSYGWDRGWSTERIEQELKALGVELVAPAVSASEQGTYSPMKIDTGDLDKCRELGKAVAKAVA